MQRLALLEPGRGGAAGATPKAAAKPRAAAKKAGAKSTPKSKAKKAGKGAKKPKAARMAAKGDSYGCGGCGATFGSQKAAVAHALTHTSS